MRSLAYPLYAIASRLMAIIAILLSPLIALFVDTQGNLPSLLRWFQTPDAPATGAPFWKQQHPTYSNYLLALTWLVRNPAQGFDQVCKVNATLDTPVKFYGNLNISDGIYAAPIGGWFLITGAGGFQFSAIIPCRSFTIDIGAGWRLDPIAKGYQTPTLGALIFTPLRLHKI
jgi:hypothetical protein